ncbi:MULTISPECIES: chemotaxis protein CheA [unclassified Paenibacillus]|uniref:chemotaxis protein CheA n=1 Tax=unclassified Paenibacillus TaxID=185978 RepID=UPI000CFAEB24|nr:MULTISPECIES: chemotaxis protein CheA [unclassified Paenibacillus]MBD8836554.1 chemotaxis protein CheA [Paenibacillus sp. CFBP 13594]PRA04959.1 chemotaxis protein CheA [Paenibacillus sp. MYb63]PRA47696.1 chemotaxis protein CheA [Paenibacillus sp. MYb67]QZN74836.1 chemotaxis protein CheA [Paenibacillus sp. DR312]
MMDLSAYRDIFIEELNDQLERMDQSLLALELSPSVELVQTLFRAAHTIKGSASTMDFRELSDLTHEVEYALEWVREKKPEMTSELIDTLFRSLDAMKVLRDQYIRGEAYGDFRAVVREIKDLIQTQAVVGQLKVPQLQSAESIVAQVAIVSGKQLLSIHIVLEQKCMMKAARYHILRQRIEDICGTVVATSLMESQPGAQNEDDHYGQFIIIVATSKDPQQLKAELSSDSDIHMLEIDPYLLESNEVAAGSAPLELISETEQTKQRLPALNTTGPDEKVKAAQPTVRVSVERLDHLMNLVGELLIDQTSLADLSGSGARKESSSLIQSIGGVSDHMGRVIKELQEGVMKTRMLPIDQLFSRFPRLVRDLAQKLGKDLELVIQGGETELDRMIIEELSDPLIHLIRNSADHGIESAVVRGELGKPSKGRITLTSFHEENHVVIRYSDDGKGIDGEKIKASALGKGIISEEQAARLSTQEAVHLIFEPGFSTASSVSEVSGRGVGMDIVRSQIGRLSGIIDIDTEVGVGTTFTIRLPLTLAIIKGLLVKVSGRVLILPMYNVAEIVRISPEDIQMIQGQQAILNHGRIVPFHRLCDRLNYSRTDRKSKTIPLVIVRSVDKIAAYAVDEIIGNQEVVIKTLGTYLGAMSHLSGATILGNGKVALILDASYLVSL